MKSILMSLAATAMVAAPVAASAATNPATSLSVTHARAASPTGKNSNLLGASGTAGIYAAVILAGIIAIIVIGATYNNNSDSN